MPRLSLLPVAALCILFVRGIDASTPPEASEPASPSVEKPRPDPSVNPEFQNAKPQYPGKSLFHAYGWMLLGTAIPLAASTVIPVDGTSGDASAVAKSLLFAGGLLVGPSGGQIYAGSYGRSALAVAVRTTGLAMILRAWSLSEPIFCSDCGDSDGSMIGAWFLGGIVVYAGGVVYSMYDQEKAVERYNAKLRGNGAFGWSPTLAPQSDGSLRTGATAWMRF
jgi:hypothetical protein